MSWITIVAAIVGYFLRHFDPASVHVPESDTVKALKAAEKIRKEKSAADMVEKFTNPTPPTPPA